MKVQLVSDLHMEFLKNEHLIPYIPNVGGDVLILAGDICNVRTLHRNPIGSKFDGVLNTNRDYFNAKCYREFFAQVSRDFKTVLMVMGNHEYYNGLWEETEKLLREELKAYPNILLLQNNKVVIDNVVFLGATFWSDLHSGSPLVKIVVKNGLNDYFSILNHDDGRFNKLTPEQTIESYHETMSWLEKELKDETRKIVVIGHNPPSWNSIHERYLSDNTGINYAFANNLEEFILDRPQIKLWVGGHVHHRHQYYIGSTLVAVNPKGYYGEDSGFNIKEMFDLEVI